MLVLFPRDQGALRSWFDRERLNWPDLREFSLAELRSGEGPPFPVYWCHGAIGIGMVRLRLHEITNRNDDAAEAEAAILSALRLASDLEQHGRPYDLSLCHGLGGAVELLLEGPRVFRQPELRAHALDTVALGVDLAGSETGPWPCGVPDGGENPSLMVGMAGIGLTFLRAADPAVAPAGMLYTQPMDSQRIIVKFGDEVDAAARLALTEEVVARIDEARLERVSRHGRILLEVPGNAPIDEILSELNEHPAVAYAEEDVVDSAQG